MEGREKRIDLRLGAFACSLQGFDDPIPPLTRILQELRDVQAAMPDGGRPLFDADTLRRLEGEIAALAGEGISASPGLVLAPDSGADAEDARAAAPGIPAADPDPDAALAGLRAAVLSTHEPDGSSHETEPEPPAAPEETAEATGVGPDGSPPPETGARETAEQDIDAPLAPTEGPSEPSPAAGEMGEENAADRLAAESPGVGTEAEAPKELGDVLGAASTEPSADVEQGDALLEMEAEGTEEHPAALQDREEQVGDDDAVGANLFAAESDDDAAFGTAANLFDDAEADMSAFPAPAPGANEASASETAAGDEAEQNGNLFAAGAEPGAEAGYAVENLFGDPETEEAGPAAQAETEDAASARSEPPAADEAEAPRAAEPESGPAAGDAEPSSRAGEEPGDDPDEDEGAAANLFAEADEEEPVGINLFDDDAAVQGAAAADPDEETDTVDAPIRPGAFRSLDRFNPRTPAAPDEDDLPPLRSYENVSAEELAKRAKAEAPVELMAAAAAWLTVVKGHGSFTKREVIELFEALPGDHPRTAEVKVKGFGRLVRNGQVKLGDDQRFRLTEAERDRYEALLE